MLLRANSRKFWVAPRMCSKFALGWRTCLSQTFNPSDL